MAGGELLLVVEDEDAIRDVARRLLTRNGYQVITAANGPEAIALADRDDRRIDLLITDVVMPHMLGKEVAEHLLAQRPQMRVLYMSGYAQPTLAAQGTLDPSVRLVEKPFTEAALLSNVRDALATGIPLDDAPR